MVNKIDFLSDRYRGSFYFLFYSGLFLFTVLIPIQDTSLSETSLRFLGKSPSFLFLCFVFSLSFLKFGLDRVFIFIFLYVCFLNFLSFLEYADFFEYGRSLKIKGISLFILNFIFLIPFFFNMNKSFFPKRFDKVVLLSFFICLIGVLLVDVFDVSFFSSGFFHVDKIEQTRFRGLSYEPSMLALTIISLYLCYICIAKKEVRFIDLVLVFSLAFLIQSKGGILCLLLSCLIAFKSVLYMLKRRYLVVILIAFLSSFAFLVSMFVLDFDKYTSTITRGTLVLVPLMTLFHHPFGVGYFGFLDAFHQYLPEAVNFSKSYINHEKGFREIDKYLITKTDSSIGSKSFFLNNIIVFGWPFIVLYFYVLIRAVRKCRELLRKDLEILVWFIFFSLTLFVEGVGLYALSLGFLVCRYEMYCANQKDKMLL